MEILHSYLANGERSQSDWVDRSLLAFLVPFFILQFVNVTRIQFEDSINGIRPIFLTFIAWSAGRIYPFSNNLDDFCGCVCQFHNSGPAGCLNSVTKRLLVLRLSLLAVSIMIAAVLRPYFPNNCLYLGLCPWTGKMTQPCSSIGLTNVEAIEFIGIKVTTVT